MKSIRRLFFVSLLSIAALTNVATVHKANAEENRISISSISLSSTSSPSNRNFFLNVSVDAGNLKIYRISAKWAPKNYKGQIAAPFGPAIPCSGFRMAGVTQEPLYAVSRGSFDLICEPSPDLPKQEYFLWQFEISATSCPETVLAQLSFDCTENNGRNLVFYNVGIMNNGSGELTYLPGATTSYIKENGERVGLKIDDSIFRNLPNLLITDASKYSGPEMVIDNSQQYQIRIASFSAPISPVSRKKASCQWNTKDGNVFTSSVIERLKRPYDLTVIDVAFPGTQVSLQVDCTDVDGQIFSSNLKLQSAIPNPPKVPQIVQVSSVDEGVKFRILNYVSSGMKYEIVSTSGGLALKDSLIEFNRNDYSKELSFSIRATDQFGQSTLSELVKIPAKKQINIIRCVKGKFSKVIKGENPICPTGYKKKN